MFTKEGLSEQFRYPFSDQATAVFNFAEEEVRKLNHQYIGDEHLLLGLLRQGMPSSLANLGIMINIENCRGSLELIGGRSSLASPDLVTIAPRAIEVIRLSITEAQQPPKSELLPEHIWLGLTREREGFAAGILESLGINYASMTVLRKPSP